MNIKRKNYGSIKLVTSYAFLLFISIRFLSCSDNPVNNNTGNQSVISSLEGYVNGPLPDSTIVRAVISKELLVFFAGEDTILNNQIMNLVLSEPSKEFLWDLSSILPGSGYILSDNDARGNFAFLYTYDISNGNNNGLIFKSDTAHISFLSEGKFYMRYLYTDRGLSVSGAAFNISSTDTSKYNYNLNLGKGFNRYYVRAVVVRDSYKEYNIVSGEPPDAMWFLILYF